MSDLPPDIRSLCAGPFGNHKHVLRDPQYILSLPHIGSMRSLTGRSVSPDRLSESGSRSALRLLSHCPPSGDTCCRYLMSLVEISRVTKSTLSSVLTSEDVSVLKSLLSATGGGDTTRFQLARHFVLIADVPDSRLAAFVGTEVLDSLQRLDDRKSSPSPSGCGGPPPPGPAGETGDDAGGPVVRLKLPLWNAETRRSSGFVELIQLLRNAEVLGHRLVDLVQSVAAAVQRTSPRLLVVQTVLLVFANDCFTVSASTNGVARVLAAVKPVILGLFEARLYDAVVYLLVSIGRYSDMSYVFDGLKQVFIYLFICLRKFIG